MIQTREANYVTFYSPGTMFSETTTLPIHAWDQALACAMAKAVVERHGAKPYGFRFTTMIEAIEPAPTDRGAMAVEPRKERESGNHYIGGKVLTASEIEAMASKLDEILLSNMRCNGWARVVEVVNGYKSVHPLLEGDFLVDPDTGATLPIPAPEES